MKNTILNFFVFLIIFALFGGVLQAQSYKVIVNESNSVSSLTKDQASKLFLKKVTKWDDDKKVLPVDLVESKAARRKFTKDVHGKTIAAIRAYWQKQIFSGRAVPPPEKANDSEVLSFVKANSGAIGYVSTSASTSGVKIIEIITKDK